MIISSDGALNCCYFHMTNYYLNQFPGTPWTTYSFWPDEERSKMSYQIYETYVRPTISIRKEREVNLSIWDMHWNGGQQEENRLCQVMLAAKWEIDNDKYLTFQDNGGKPDPTSITLIRSTGALNLQHAILTLQNSGTTFSADNLSRLIFDVATNFQQLRTIMALKQCKFNNDMLYNEFAKNNFLDEYNRYAYLHMGQDERFDQDWTNAYNQAHLKFAKQEMDIALQIWGSGGTPEAYLESKETELKNAVIQEIDELINTMNQRIVAATQSQQTKENQILQMLQEANEKKQKHSREIQTSNLIHEKVKALYDRFYPRRTKEEEEAKIATYKDKDVEQAVLEIDNEFEQYDKAWNEIIYYLDHLLKKNVPEYFIADSTWSKENAEDVFKSKIDMLKNQHKGDYQSAKNQIDVEFTTKLTSITRKIIQDNELIKTFCPHTVGFLVKSNCIEFDKMEIYMNKLYPLLVEITTYRPGYFLAIFRDNYDRNALETHQQTLTAKLNEFKEREKSFEDDKRMNALVKRNSNIVTMKEIVGHCKNISEANIYINVKKE